MDNFGARTEFADCIRDTVIKPCPHRKNHITVMHGHVGFVKPVHAEHAQKLTICRRVGAQTH